ncbi:MAG: hypothetical protein GEV10_17600 [Streptosporangiales bacterium]|nr:hypothetical protein [Streptosporangiales bacterium]
MARRALHPTALRTWVCSVGPGGSGRLTGDALDDLRVGYDVVLDDRPVLEEGRPDAHGPDAFALPSASAPLDPPTLTLAGLYAGGIRTVLLNGPPALADQYLSAGAIDEAQLWLTPGLRSAEPIVGTEAFLRPGFRVHKIEKRGSEAVVHATLR